MDVAFYPNICNRCWTYNPTNATLSLNLHRHVHTYWQRLTEVHHLPVDCWHCNLAFQNTINRLCVQVVMLEAFWLSSVPEAVHCIKQTGKLGGFFRPDGLSPIQSCISSCAQAMLGQQSLTTLPHVLWQQKALKLYISGTWPAQANL